MAFAQLLVLCSILASPALAITFNDESGFGSAGPARYGDDVDRLFANGARNPLVSNNVTFQGWDFTLAPADLPQTLRTTANWTMHLNYSAVDVTDAVDSSGNTSQLVSTITYGFAFPNDQSLPSQNATDWTLCGYFLTMPFPSNISDRFRDETGDCSATLGQECRAAYQSAILTAEFRDIGNSSCSPPPFWSSIPECVSEIGIEFAMASGSLMYPGGLNSTDPIFYQSSRNYNQSETSNYFDQYANQMRMAIFTFQPNQRWLNANPEGPLLREVQFTCRTANPTPDETSAASSLVSSFWMIIGTMVATTLLQF